MSRHSVKKVYLGLLVLLGLLLQACGSLSPHASMRVEVEVYKGPLSKPLHVQWGELKGVIESAYQTFQEQGRYLESSTQFCTSGAWEAGLCQDVKHFQTRLTELNAWVNGSLKPQKIKLCKGSESTACSKESVSSMQCDANNVGMDRVSAAITKFVIRDKKDLVVESSSKIDKGDYEIVQCVFREIANLGMQMKARALVIPNKLIPSVPSNQRLFRPDHKRTSCKAKAVPMQRHQRCLEFPDKIPSKKVVRQDVIQMANLLSEFGNLLNARANALLMQTAANIRRYNLPLSVYLSDSQPTDYPNLFDWYKATKPGWLLDGSEWVSFSVPPRDARVKAYQRLFADTYWSKVNTVYASGSGKVGMALIRDDIGNWNLKSFDNEPEGLLTAYRNMSLALVNQATKIVKSVAADSSGASILKQVATDLNRATSPSAGDGPVSQSVAKLRDNTLKKLQEIKNVPDDNARYEQVNLVVQDMENGLKALEKLWFLP